MHRKTLNLVSAAIIALGGMYFTASPAYAGSCDGPAGSGGCTCTSGDGNYTCTGDSCTSTATGCSYKDKAVAPASSTVS